MSRSAKAFFVNALTFARVPLVFAWAAFAVMQEFALLSGSPRALGLAVAACVALTLSGFTDLWDGRLARRWDVVSPLGKMADPLMDKVFYIVAFPVLAWQIMHQGPSDEATVHGLVMLAFAVLYFLRDTWVTFLRSVGAMYGADVAAMMLGKVRTALSFPCAGWVYAYLAFHGLWRAELGELTVRLWLDSCYAFEALLMVLTLVSFFTYTSAYWPFLKKALANGRDL